MSELCCVPKKESFDNNKCVKSFWIMRIQLITIYIQRENVLQTFRMFVFNCYFGSTHTMMVLIWLLFECFRKMKETNKVKAKEDCNKKLALQIHLFCFCCCSCYSSLSRNEVLRKHSRKLNWRHRDHIEIQNVCEL